MNEADSGRSLWERVLASAPRPRVLADYTPPPRQLAEGLHVFDRRESFLGRGWLVFRMTVAVLPAGDLWVHAPVPLDRQTRETLDALGPVAVIVAPNAFHYLHLAAYREAYPEAALHLAPGLAERVQWLPRGQTLGAASTFGGVFDVHVFGPTRRTSEVAFVHRPSRTLILTDLAKNVAFEDCLAPEPSALARLEVRAMLRTMGTRPGFGPDRNARLVFLSEPERVRRDLEAIARLDFDRVVVNHGRIVETGGQKRFREAFAPWLREAAPRG